MAISPHDRRALEIWLVQLEMVSKYRTQTGFEDFVCNKYGKHLSNF